MKKFIITNAIITIMVSVFLIGYTSAFQLSVYADDVIDEWQNVTTTDEMAEAFRYYCKSRDLTIDGSIANAVTTFTTRTFNGLCNFLGVDMTAIQANLKYNVDSNGVKRFLFSNDIINTYNRIFAQFLQDNNLTVGDVADEQNNTVFNGHYWTCDGYTSLCYELDYVNSNYVITVRGTPFAYDTERLKSITPPQGQKSSVTIKFDNSGEHTFTWNVQQFYVSNINYWVFHDFNNTNHNTNYLFAVSNDPNVYAIPMVIYSNNYYYWGRYYTNDDGVTNGRFQTGGLGNSSNRLVSTSGESGNVNIFLTTNNTVINNNNYEGDTIINNNGEPSDPNAPDPDDPSYNPYPDGGGSISPPGTIGGNGSDGTINFPDLNLNLPEINWSLGDLSDKFPFSIPFDMIAFLTLLNGEPQAPHITGTIPLTTHYTWELDLDFSQFDTFAGIMRGLEFVGFMFFLISATINIVRG